MGVVESGWMQQHDDSFLKYTSPLNCFFLVSAQQHVGAVSSQHQLCFLHHLAPPHL